MKKLGFDLEVNHCYYDDSLEELCESNVSNYYNVNSNDFVDFFCSAPTLAQAQKFLIRNKNYFIMSELSTCERWGYVIYDVKNQKRVDFELDNYNSYEESLSAGITKCIEILENEKIHKRT